MIAYLKKGNMPELLGEVDGLVAGQSAIGGTADGVGVIPVLYRARIIFEFPIDPQKSLISE